MREIKFRIYDKHNKVWKYFKAGECIFDGIFDTESLGQFTGLHDKKGKEVWEGDQVRNERGEVGVIVFNNGAFVSEYLPPHNWDAMEPCDGLLDRQTVIGNIYENPERLGDKP